MRIPERQAELDAFYRKYLDDDQKAGENGHRPSGATAYLPTVVEVIQKLVNEKTGKGRALFEGDTRDYKSGSEADQAFFNKVYFWTQDFDQIVEVYRRSGLNREKGNRPDYLRRTYMKAANLITEFYDWRRGRNMPTNPEDSDNPANQTDSGKPTTPTHDELRDRYTAVHEDCSYGLGEWRRYQEGIWPAVPDLSIKRSICEVIEAAKPEGVKPTNSLLSSVTELTRVKVSIPDDLWDADPDILVCKNGVLRISTRELEPHRQKHYATSAVPYDYDPKAVPVVWDYFMNNTVHAAKAFLQEFAGIALTTNMAHEVALWLFGPPGSGKSTFLAGIQAMLGHRAGLLGLAEIERNRFALADLPGKTLVAASEQPSAYLASTNVLNQIISGEPLQVERKYRDPVTFVPRCKIAWAMNELPRVGDANSGLFRRVKVVKFPALPPDERDPEIKRDIEGEGAGILNWALDGLDRLQKRGHFEVPAGVEEATTQFRENNDVPALFVADRCVEDPAAKEKAGELYSEYKQWCEDNGHRPQSSTRLADDWQRLGFERYRAKGSTFYRGVRVRLPGE